MPKNFRPDMRADYISRINRVIDYINNHIDDDLSLRTLSRIAMFSPFHFHRIFHAFIGETLNHFIQRVRVEKAAMLLVANSSVSVTEVAMDCGFSGPATLGRAFKETFGMSASQWRSGGHRRYRKIRKTNGNLDQQVGNPSKDIQVSSMYIDPASQNLTWRIKMTDKMEAKVEVRDLPEMHIAYLRHIGPYQGDSELFGKLFEKLFQWAGPRGLCNFPETKLMTFYYDNPDVTDPDKLRVDVAISVPEDTSVDGEIGKMAFAGGKYAMARFELLTDQYQQAWDAVYSGWLPNSGFQPDDRPCFELYLNDPKQHPEGRCVVDICIPVKPI